MTIELVRPSDVTDADTIPVRHGWWMWLCATIEPFMPPQESLLPSNPGMGANHQMAIDMGAAIRVCIEAMPDDFVDIYIQKAPAKTSKEKALELAEWISKGAFRVGY